MRESVKISMRSVAAFSAAAISLMFLQTPIRAASVSTLAPSVLIDPNAAADGLGGGFADFDTPASVTTYGNSSPSQGTFVQSGATFSGDGILMTNAGLDALGLYAEPYHDTTQYLTVNPYGPTETVNFSATYQTLGLYWGSMDTYNSIIFYLAGNVVDIVTGSQAAAAIVPPANANGYQADDSNNRYVLITDIGSGGFDKIVLQSTQNSFELDNLAWGPGVTRNTLGSTPLPAALPMFAGALGGAALVGAWRKRRKAAA